MAERRMLPFPEVRRLASHHRAFAGGRSRALWGPDTTAALVVCKPCCLQSVTALVEFEQLRLDSTVVRSCRGVTFPRAMLSMIMLRVLCAARR